MGGSSCPEPSCLGALSGLEAASALLAAWVAVAEPLGAPWPEPPCASGSASRDEPEVSAGGHVAAGSVVVDVVETFVVFVVVVGVVVAVVVAVDVPVVVAVDVAVVVFLVVLVSAAVPASEPAVVALAI